MKDNKKSSKRDVIENHIRVQIVRNDLPPGARLPTRDELVQEFHTSKTTVQGALNALLKQGFAVSRGSAGTFVAETPPHRYRYGLVFGWRPTDNRPWSRFWKAIQHEAMVLHQENKREMITFCGAPRSSVGIFQG